MDCMLVLVHLFCDPTQILSLIGGERLQVTQELGPFVDIIARRGENKWGRCGTKIFNMFVGREQKKLGKCPICLDSDEIFMIRGFGC